MVVIKKIIIIIFFLYSIVSKPLNASRILDYETELFIKNIVDEIRLVNNVKQEIKFIIVKDKNINAFVDENNIISVTSGLIESCDDYVAFLGVIAHEIGHIHRNHINQRKINLNKLSSINHISNLSIIAGSLISSNPALIQGVALNSATTSNYFINFSKDQEREADYYSLETLSKLNLYSKSVINLLNVIEKKSLEKGLTKERLKVSTHPYFDERIEVINYFKGKNKINFDKDTNLKFNFIKAKFLGYNGNENKIKSLDEPFKTYAYSIFDAKNGKLKNSMVDLNSIIKLNTNNYFLLETKADILFSYGYTNEALKFYQIVLNNFPENLYSQIRILENTDLNKLTKSESEKLFSENLNLFEKYYNNKNMLLMYLNLSKIIGREDWTRFISYWLEKNDDLETIKRNLIKFKKTDDKDLIRIIEKMQKNII